MSAIDLDSLTVEERLQLLDEVWESLYATPEGIPLFEWQREELNRKIDDLEREGPTGSSWAEAESRIRARFK